MGRNIPFDADRATFEAYECRIERAALAQYLDENDSNEFENESNECERNLVQECPVDENGDRIHLQPWEVRGGWRSPSPSR